MVGAMAFRHDFGGEQLEALADVLMRGAASLVQQDHLVDMSLDAWTPARARRSSDTCCLDPAIRTP
jgi:hypothetical protein